MRFVVVGAIARVEAGIPGWASPDNEIPHKSSLGALHPARRESVADFISCDLTADLAVTPQAEGIAEPRLRRSFALPAPGIPHLRRGLSQSAHPFWLRASRLLGTIISINGPNRRRRIDKPAVI